MRWNGRQIRNACQTALALAEFDAQGGSHERVVDADAEVKLTVDHLKIVSNAYLQFIMYLKKIYGQYGERRAKAMGIRAREGEWKKKHEEEEEEDVEEKKVVAATKHHTAPAKATPQPEHSAPSQPTYPYPPLPNVPGGGYPPWPPGYPYPPQGYPSAGWQPPQGVAAGQYGGVPIDVAGGRQ
jgi:hypothetical protein